MVTHTPHMSTAMAHGPMQAMATAPVHTHGTYQIMPATPAYPAQAHLPLHLKMEPATYPYIPTPPSASYPTYTYPPAPQHISPGSVDPLQAMLLSPPLSTYGVTSSYCSSDLLLDVQLVAILGPLDSPPPSHQSGPTTLCSPTTSATQSMPDLATHFCFEDLEVDLLALVATVNTQAYTTQPPTALPTYTPMLAVTSAPLATNTPTLPTPTPMPSPQLAPSRASAPPHSPAPNGLKRAKTEPPHTVTPLPPLTSHQTERQSSTSHLVRGLKMKGRRRTKAELSRLYVCKEQQCPRQFEHWRSLQYHYWASHGMRCRKMDYTQKGNLGQGRKASTGTGRG